MKSDRIAAQGIRVGDNCRFRQGHDFYGPVTLASKDSSKEKEKSSVNDTPDLLSPYFTGRSDELDQIKHALDQPRGDAPARCTVYGMPGLGKTQLALKYSDLAFEEQRYPFVFWISAASVEKLNQGFSKLLDLVCLANRINLDQSARCTAARVWLEDGESEVKRKWLLVLDNINQETSRHAREMLPRSNSNGSVLMTTRTKHVAESITVAFGKQHLCIGLRVPSVDDAVALLLRAAEIDRERLGQTERKEAREVVKSIGRLPLAVDQAASFIKESGSGISDVLDIYRSEQVDQVFEWENDLSRYEQRSVMATFASALRQVELMPPETGDLLRILAFLDPESVPVDMLKEGCVAMQGLDGGSSASVPITEAISNKPINSPIFHRLKGKISRRMASSTSVNRVQENAAKEVMDDGLQRVRQLIGTAVELQKTIQYLQRLSLVAQRRDGKTTTLWLHDLIQMLLRTKLMEKSERKKWLRYAISITCKAFERIEDPRSPKHWVRCEKFVAHIQAVQMHAEKYRVDSVELWNAGSWVASYLSACGRYREAVEANKLTLVGRKKMLGAEHPSTLSSMANLASTYRNQGRWKEAEELFVQVMETSSRVLGEEHPDTLSSMANLASTYRNQGRWKEAEELQRQELEICSRILGQEHFNTLISMENLALI